LSYRFPFRNVGFRIALRLHTSRVILDRWFWGYGLGSADYTLSSFPVPTGGHPIIYISFLFIWLEMGIVDAIFPSRLFLRLTSYTGWHASGKFHLSSAWAMFMAGIVIF